MGGKAEGEARVGGKAEGGARGHFVTPTANLPTLDLRRCVCRWCVLCAALSTAPLPYLHLSPLPPLLHLGFEKVCVQVVRVVCCLEHRHAPVDELDGVVQRIQKVRAVQRILLDLGVGQACSICGRGKGECWSTLS